MILCGHCGVGIEPAQNFCLNCGRPVQRRDQPLAQAPAAPPDSTANSAVVSVEQPQVVPAKSANRLVIVLIVAGLLATAAVSVAITVALIQRQGDDASTNPSRLSPSVPGSPPIRSTATPGSSPVRITATASSTRAPIGGGPYPPANVLDGDLRTAWVEGVAGPGVGEWIQLDFDREVQLSRVRITPGYFKSGKLWRENNRLAAATYHFSDGSARSVNFADQMETQSLEIAGMKTHWVRITIDNIYGGSADSEDTPISEITFDLSP